MWHYYGIPLNQLQCGEGLNQIMPTKGNVCTYTREQWMGKVYSVFQDLNDSSVSFHGCARCLSLVKWPRVDTDSRLHSTAICYLLKKSCNYKMYGLVYLFIGVFLGEKTEFQRNRQCCLFIKAIKCCETISKKIPCQNCSLSKMHRND